MDGPELGNIIKKGIFGLRMAGVSQDELDQIQMVTSRAEYDALDLKDGDVLVYGPVELTSFLAATAYDTDDNESAFSKELAHTPGYSKPTTASGCRHKPLHIRRQVKAVRILRDTASITLNDI